MPPKKKPATPDPTPTRRGPGQPSKLDAIAATTPDGRTITVRQRIIEAIRLGDYLETAAAAAGINRETLHNWLRIGARTTQRQARAEALDQPFDATPHELACQEFSNAIAIAEADAHQRLLQTLHDLSRSRKVTTTTTRTAADGSTYEHTVERELEPNAQVLMWRLERRFPALYGRRLDLNVHTDGDRFDEFDENDLARQLAAFQAGIQAGRELADDPIDTTAHEQ